MPLRSIVLIPAHGAGLDEALASAADAIAFTLAGTTVAVAELRRLACDGLARVTAAGKSGFAIVNHPRTQMLRDDAAALVGPNLRGVLLPHAVDPQDVRDLAVVLREFELQRGMEPGDIAAFPIIDTARGVLRAEEIVHAAPRVGGLVFDSASYARDIGARQEEHGPRLSFARGAVVAASRAFEKRPLVAAGSLQSSHLAQYGFAGAVIVDARTVAQVNAAFTPSSAALEVARAQAQAYDEARTRGAWVASLGPQVVDAHTARKARQSLE